MTDKELLDAAALATKGQEWPHDVARAVLAAVSPELRRRTLEAVEIALNRILSDPAPIAHDLDAGYQMAAADARRTVRHMFTCDGCILDVKQ